MSMIPNNLHNNICIAMDFHRLPSLFEFCPKTVDVENDVDPMYKADFLVG